MKLLAFHAIYLCCYGFHQTYRHYYLQRNCRLKTVSALALICPITAKPTIKISDSYAKAKTTIWLFQIPAYIPLTICVRSVFIVEENYTFKVAINNRLLLLQCSLNSLFVLDY